ncbi:ubiquitin carboxyl-terminal hydrolase 2 [[Candida] railenensis]|uniref:ubiquitinyl hydrolase 1 n=1 Tax=[Candida] railenensis TaxID=45579 RepID=A0A9P0VVI3_9ASCO|nr:ubiquitin carboxyl-terminal hydrolase 2 [[Candida] railenensis]
MVSDNKENKENTPPVPGRGLSSSPGDGSGLGAGAGEPEAGSGASAGSEDSGPGMKSNNPFLKPKPAPLMPDSIVKELPYKTLNRIINDIKWTIPYKEYISLLQQGEDAAGPVSSSATLLNSKPIEYSKKLSQLAKLYPNDRMDCMILNNSLKYAPSVEVVDADGDSSGRSMTVLRGLLVNAAKKSAKQPVLYHFQICILEVKPSANSNVIQTPVDKRAYHIIPKAIIPQEAVDYFEPYSSAPDSVIDDAFFKASNSPNDHFIRTTVFQGEFSHADFNPLFNQDIIKSRYLKAVSKYPQANLSPETIPNSINCFNTLLKVLRGPLLIGPGDQMKTINLNNPSLNSQIDIQLLFNKLSFTINEEELIPPNLLGDQILRQSYIRKILEIIYIAHNLSGTGSGAVNDFASSISFSNNLSLVYRTFNEVNQHLCSSFGNNEVDNQLPYLIDLSVCAFFQDEMIIRSFENTWKSDKVNKLQYIDSLKELIQFRTTSSNLRTSKLNTYFQTNGLHGRQDYINALKAIGIVGIPGDDLSKVDDDFIVAMYLTTFKNDPKNYTYFNKNLQTIQEIRSSEVIKSFLENEILPLNIALAELSIEEVTEDEVVITAYEFKREDLMSSGGSIDEIKYFDKALLSVAVNRKSYLLMNYIDDNMPSLLKEYNSTATTADCFANLGCSPNSNDFEIILAFQKKLLDTNSDIRNLRQYLKIIIESKKSKLLERFLSTGQIDVSLLPAENWPAGLDNIGNTCYLNSLLQYYFVLKPLREMILGFNENEEINQESDIVRKIGGRIVEKSETVRSNQFIYQLQALFHDMIHSEKRCVQPSKELAFLAFSPSSQQVTFTDGNKEGDSHDIEILDAENDGDVDDDVEILDTSPIMVSSQSPSPPPLIQDVDEMDVDSIEVSEPNKEVVKEIEKNKNGSKILTISTDTMDSTIEMGRQQDVTECIENVTFQIESALKPEKLDSDGEQYDLIKKLFYGKTKQKITPLNPDSTNKERTSIERFSSLIINVSDHPKDIYDSLDNYFSEDLVKLEDGEVKKSLTISELPEILQFHVQRVLFDREKLMPYKSLEPIPFSEKIYVDRYLDTEDPEILKKRNEVFKWKYEINDLLEKKEKVTKKESGSQMTIIDTLLTANRYLRQRLESQKENVSEGGVDMEVEVEGEEKFINEENQTSEDRVAPEVGEATTEGEQTEENLATPQIINSIENKISELRQEVKDIDSKLLDLKEKVSNQFKDYNQVGYSVFAIFIHRGEASYGHYWIYIKDPQRNVFRKYNDETVTEVPFSEVMNFEEGNTATPYYIVYVKDSLEEEYIQPLKRNITKN